MFQLRWLWKNMSLSSRAKYLAAIVLSCVTCGMLLLNADLVAKLIDSVILARNPDPLIPLLIMMFGFTLIRLLLRYLMVIFFEQSSQNTVATIKEKLFHSLQYQEMQFFNRIRTGDLMTRLSADVEWCRHFIAFLTYQVSDCLTLFIATLIMFFFTSWKLTLALIAVMPLLLVITKIYSKMVHPKFVGMRDRLSEMNTAAQENIAGNRVVKAFARETYEKDRFDERNRSFRDANLDINKLWLTFFPFIELASNLMTWITIFLGGCFIISGDLTAGGLSIFSGMAWALANPMRNLGNLINDLQRFNTSASKIIEVYYSRPLITDREDAIPHPQPAGDIEFDHVNFSFGSVKVLEDISFSVKAGETLAIMGPTGSGKTTLVNLLARFYDPQSGEIRLDGDNVRFWKLEELRKAIGTATQDVFLFSDTAEGNIAFGNQSLSEEQVYEYATRAAADDFIRKMPDGYDTIVGERGVGLSGGQKQRIALARAMAVHPAVLVLDDTTSALDMETERYIQEQLSKLPYPCTKIIIAQRISSVKDADQILVLQDGRITEQGKHEELLKNRGYYWDTYAVQNDIAQDDKKAEQTLPEDGSAPLEDETQKGGDR